MQRNLWEKSEDMCGDTVILHLNCFSKLFVTEGKKKERKEIAYLQADGKKVCGIY